MRLYTFRSRRYGFFIVDLCHQPTLSPCKRVNSSEGSFQEPLGYSRESSTSNPCINNLHLGRTANRPELYTSVLVRKFSQQLLLCNSSLPLYSAMVISILEAFTCRRSLSILCRPDNLCCDAATGVKVKQVWECEECGESSTQWTGKCKNCQEWNTYAFQTIYLHLLLHPQSNCLQSLRL